MRKFLYITFRYLYFHKLCPWRLWSLIYDKLHDKVEDAWIGG